MLESAQAGLSWITILRKRENYRKAYDISEASVTSKISYSYSCLSKCINANSSIAFRNPIKHTP